jgi:hypothetical protein
MNKPLFRNGKIHQGSFLTEVDDWQVAFSIPLKAHGFLASPTTQNLSLYEPEAFAQHRTIIHSLRDLWHGAFCSVSKARVFVFRHNFSHIINFIKL